MPDQKPTLPPSPEEIAEAIRKRAAKEVRAVKTYLRKCNGLEKVDASTLERFALAVAEFEHFTEYLQRKGYTRVDKNGDPRRRPEVFLRKDADEAISRYAKLLGIDRNFREKGRGESLAKGRRPVDKIGRLRKVS
ncbi:P27 family phage terminase small subunit [Lewinella sp. JB7]|uniref:P27 family phage terminase small subunit n=1 Tax=Lewinella sp. JB7 TaxID=2962887 RepID=UPI0020C97574|nr:P27 family phage terminase small subunit [Lewinella sp. JB7]MCP9237146.1 P27 family phage terminase small subunit [Lewinella sp. JB7]